MLTKHWALEEISDRALGIAVHGAERFVSRGRWAGAQGKTFDPGK